MAGITIHAWHPNTNSRIALESNNKTLWARLVVGADEVVIFLTDEQFANLGPLIDKINEALHREDIQ